jgi:hypothetical protein
MSSALISRALTLAATVFLMMSGQAWAQDRAPASEQQVRTADPFAAYHDALNSSADSLLVRLDERGMAIIGSSEVGANIEQRKPSMLTERKGGSQAMLRVQQLRLLIDPILRQEGVPTELAAVVLVESSGQPLALSPKGARGIWQFMPETARRYGLVVDANHDERLDVLKSTGAAARYLRDLYAQFGNWPLALAAYNSGERLLQQVVDSTGSNDFAIIRRRLPVETQNYVPAVLAATGTFKASATPAMGPDHEGPQAQITFASLETGN